MTRLTVLAAVVTLVATLGLATVGFTTMAQAQEIEEPVAQVNRCAGNLHAEGDGIAMLAGRGTIELEGNGTLWLKDVSGDAQVAVEGYGEKEEYDDGWVQYSGFGGTASIEGSRIIVMVAGSDIDLKAQGCGRVKLWGHGSFDINGRTGSWGSFLPTRMILMSPIDTQS